MADLVQVIARLAVNLEDLLFTDFGLPIFGPFLKFTSLLGLHVEYITSRLDFAIEPELEEVCHNFLSNPLDPLEGCCCLSFAVLSVNLKIVKHSKHYCLIQKSFSVRYNGMIKDVRLLMPEDFILGLHLDPEFF